MVCIYDSNDTILACFSLSQCCGCCFKYNWWWIRVEQAIEIHKLTLCHTALFLRLVLLMLVHMGIANTFNCMCNLMCLQAAWAWARAHSFNSQQINTRELFHFISFYFYLSISFPFHAFRMAKKKSFQRTEYVCHNKIMCVCVCRMLACLSLDRWLLPVRGCRKGTKSGIESIGRIFPLKKMSMCKACGQFIALAFVCQVDYYSVQISSELAFHTRTA